MGTPTRIASALLPALLSACATTLPGPAVELTADCRVVAAASGSGGRGGGYGGGSPLAQATPADLLLAQSPPPSPSPNTSDGVPSSTGSSDGGGRRHSSSDGGTAAAVAGAVAAAVGAVAFAHYNSPAEVLSREGPVLPAEFSMSCLPIRGFVQGNWPLVLDYEADGTGRPRLEVYLAADRPAYVRELDPDRGRHLLHLTLPAELAADPTPALLLVKARRDDDGGPAWLQLYGLGAGPRAVGSVAIDPVEFGPPVVRRSSGEQAHYRFYSRSDFNRLAVEILHYAGGERQIRSSMARQYPVASDKPSKNRWFDGTWDGRDGDGRALSGLHSVQVRAWQTKDDRSWVAGWTAQHVRVGD